MVISLHQSVRFELRWWRRFGVPTDTLTKDESHHECTSTGATFKEGDYLIENRVLIREQSVYNISIELSVRPSELIPLISGGEARQVGVNNDVTLDAAQSIDPDVAQLSPATLFRYVLINFGSHYIIMKL